LGSIISLAGADWPDKTLLADARGVWSSPVYVEVRDVRRIAKEANFVGDELEVSATGERIRIWGFSAKCSFEDRRFWV
jgi:hypothetical protein